LSFENVNLVKDPISYILLREPLLGLLLKRTWILGVRDKNLPVAYTDGLKIYVNLEKFSELNLHQRSYVLAHEIMHIILYHPLRAKSLMRKYGNKFQVFLNFVADAVVNERLDQSQISTDIEAIRCVDIERTVYFYISDNFIDDCRTKTLEEIVEMILSNFSRKVESNVDYYEELLDKDLIGKDIGEENRVTRGYDVFNREGKSGEGRIAGEHVVLNRGDEDDLDRKDAKEIEKRIMLKLNETYLHLKTAGKVPGHLEKIVSELLKPRIDWRTLLRRNLIGSNVSRTWAKPSRKHPMFPGKKFSKKASTIVLVDTSGSIGLDELRQFVTEIYYMLKNKSIIVVIPWDAEPYEPIKLERESDIRKLKLTGGGGTRILPALKLVDEKYSKVDNIVILSDWEIYDIDEENVLKLLKKYRYKIVAVTTSASPPSFLRTVKIDLW